MNEASLSKRNIVVWSLYDFANSIMTVVFFLYFSQWLVIENKVPDLYYNLIFTGSSLLLILSSPIIGAVADKSKKVFYIYSFLRF